MRTNWHLWSGIYRCVMTGNAWTPDMCRHSFPTVVVDVDLKDWALPLAAHIGGPLLGKPGVTVSIGPVKIGWSRL